MKVKRQGVWQEPVWRPADNVLRAKLPRRLLPWLYDRGSLTLRLQQASGGDFSVRVLSQGWQRPLLNERLALAMGHHEYGMVRQVQLICQGQPWVYARSVIPARTMSGAGRQLAMLGNRPLGAFLFANNGVVREPMEIACVHPDEMIYNDATAGLGLEQQKVWGRRSVFRFEQKPLLVSEFFLPSIPAR